MASWVLWATPLSRILLATFIDACREIPVQGSVDREPASGSIERLHPIPTPPNSSSPYPNYMFMLQDEGSNTSNSDSNSFNFGGATPCKSKKETYDNCITAVAPPFFHDEILQKRGCQSPPGRSSRRIGRVCLRALRSSLASQGLACCPSSALNEQVEARTLAVAADRRVIQLSLGRDTLFG